jgi:hypothetical protein
LKYIIRFSIFNFFFDQIESDLSKMDQNGSNLIKFDFWWNNHSNTYIIRFSNLFIFWSNLIRSVKMDKNGLKWTKMDQTWSNLISDEIIIEIYHQIFNFIYFLIKMDQNGSKWIKLDQIGFLMKYIIRFSNLFIFWSKWTRSVQNG